MLIACRGAAPEEPSWQTGWQNSGVGKLASTSFWILALTSPDSQPTELTRTHDGIDSLGADSHLNMRAHEEVTPQRQNPIAKRAHAGKRASSS